MTLSRSGETPSETRYVFAAFARLSPRARLYSAVPRSSAWPSTVIIQVAYFFSTSAFALTIIRPWSSSSWLSTGKNAGLSSPERFKSSSADEATASSGGRTTGASSTLTGGGVVGGGGKGFGSARTVSTGLVVVAGSGVVVTFGWRGLHAAALTTSRVAMTMCSVCRYMVLSLK